MNSAKSYLLALIICLPFSLYAQTACIDGLADGYACNNIDLLAHLSTDVLLAEEKDGIILNDVWGWTDPDTGKEYVIVGMANGTSFVNISDPLNPLMLGVLPEHHTAQSAKSSGIQRDGEKSIWRDIKVYKNYAYIA